MANVNLEAAKLFARRAREIQSHGDKLENAQRPHQELQAFVSATVLHAVGYLEAHINEFLLDIADLRFEDQMDETAAQRRIRILWDEALKGSASILPKYQASLGALDCQPFRKGEQPYQATQTLVTLRNFLVHHVPSSTQVFFDEAVPASQPAMVQKLAPYVKTNPWHAQRTTGALSQMLWAGTAEWSLEAAQEFISAYEQAIKDSPAWDK